ncbi:MAG: hypothetical protein H6575_19835 [Lewinellaceae bacterium]|nr:hypothetical protein [Lewinellaceae bacterium]
MRFSSFLPMLLLVGALQAQNPCNIYDLTATVTNFSASNCEYFITIKFKYDNTTNQFSIMGNGNNYGTYTYDQLPVVLGPFTAGNSASVKEFVVKDVEFNDCQDDTTVDIPACSSNASCDINNVKVVPGACVPGSLTYQLSLDFEVTNPGNDFFEVWAGNGQYLGLFPLSQLPLTIPNFPWDGDPVDHVKICINDNPDCCATVSFQAPDCLQAPCNIDGLTVETGGCTADSSYKVLLNFSTTTPDLMGVFGVWANGQLLGLYNLDDLPLSIDSFPWNGGDTDEVMVCAVNANSPSAPPVCCKTLEFDVPDCLPFYPCGIKELKLETDTCTSDSTFSLWVKFSVNDSTAVDSFYVWGNGELIGMFEYIPDSLPLHIDSFPWNGNIFNEIRICTGNDPGCCKELQFLAPDCLPFGPCEVTDIAVHTGACTSDSTYKLQVNFQATNPGDGNFVLWANGDLVDTFSLTEVPLFLDSFPWGGGDVDVVKICISGATPDTVACCLEEEFHAPDCLFACDITSLTVDPGNCNPDAQTYSVTVNFDVVNANNDFFEVWTGSGHYLGLFPISQLPVTISEVPCSNSGNGKIRVCINDSQDCCAEVAYQEPDCCSAGPCEISSLSVETGDCTSDSTYQVWVNFSVSNPLGDEFSVWANGEFFGTYPLDSLPLQISDFPWNGGQNDVIKVCFITPNGSPACCKTKEFHVPDCLSQTCEIYNLTVDVGDCTGDSTYTVSINFDVANAPGDIFGVWANGEFLGTHNLDQLPLTIMDFPWNGGQNDVVKVCFIDINDPNSSPTCCRVKEFAVPNCLMSGGPCEIWDLVVDTGTCTGDSTYEVTLNFQVANPPGNMFAVWANGEFFGSYNLDELPLTIPNFPWNGGVKDVLKVCFATNGAISCCATNEFYVPDCLNNGGGDCELFYLNVDVGDCTGDSTYTAEITFMVNNPPSNTFGLWANGEFLGTYSLDDVPVTVEDFPWNGGPNDVVKACMFDDNNEPTTCCETIEFPVPACLSNSCEVLYLAVDVGDCTGDSTYNATINFMVNNAPSDIFGVWANGDFIGTYNLDELPLTIEDFPWNGGQNDVVKVCLYDGNEPTSCCQILEFAVPGCLNTACEVFYLDVEVGDCTGDSTYIATINFMVNNPPSNTFGLWANGDLIGTYNLDELPLTIEDFPWNGGQNDVVKVCMYNDNEPTSCCQILEFAVPGCLQNPPCEIWDLVVDTGDCTGDSTYEVTINFMVANPPGDNFAVWANGAFFGSYSLDDLPLTIPDFPWNGGAKDVIKVCFANNGAAGCCATNEFYVPDCLDNGGGDCELFYLNVEVGDCTGDSTYIAEITFMVNNPPSDSFGLWANGQYLGAFNVNDLPVTVEDFPWNGGPSDEVKACMLDANNEPTTCCETIDFAVPACLSNSCEVIYLDVEVGDCTGDSTYIATINFMVNNAPSSTFGVSANGEFIGTYTLDELPLTIEDFPWDGGAADVVTVCMYSNNEPTDCCQTLEFAVPGCLNPGGPCEIAGLMIDTGDCTGDSTYNATIDFTVFNPATDTFGVWANATFLGTFGLNELPLTIEDFPWDGGSNDVITICIYQNNEPTACCQVLEFAVPGCLNTVCEVSGLTVDVGDCTGDSTYNATINFMVNNAPGSIFGVWANGNFIGTHTLDELPLTIEDFPWNGGSNDEVRVCMYSNNEPTDCCQTVEFAVPLCLDPDMCSISDLLVIPTPCLCGQFFVAVTFNSQNGGIGGFEIVGNGNNYGSFPYNTQQPIILGPFMGDATTQFEFAVADIQFQDCYADILLGSIDCMTPVIDPHGDPHLVIAPNPTSYWLNVTAQLPGGLKIGEANVDIYHPDGRLVRTLTVPDGNNFQLDVSDLPASVYRLSMMTSAGRLEGIFVKQ